MIVNVKPLSINEAWRGRRFKTPEYKVYEFEILQLLKKYKSIRPIGNFKIKIVWNMKNYKVADIDNCIKPFMDCLTKSGIIKDDRFCVEMSIYKKKGNNTFEFEIYDTIT